MTLTWPGRSSEQAQRRTPRAVSSTRVLGLSTHISTKHRPASPDGRPYPAPAREAMQQPISGAPELHTRGFTESPPELRHGSASAPEVQAGAVSVSGLTQSSGDKRLGAHASPAWENAQQVPASRTSGAISQAENLSRCRGDVPTDTTCLEYRFPGSSHSPMQIYSGYNSATGSMDNVPNMPMGNSGSFNAPSPSSIRHHFHRPLSPDLPTRDALYLFCNFSSYMRSPQEGAEGIRDNTDFGDTIRLLDFARHHSSEAPRNVHILHMKYRFQTPDHGPRPRNSKLVRDGKNKNENGLGLSGRQASSGKRNRTVPQPFSVLHDPVVKLDYQDSGIFEPLPAQAVFAHIAKACQPPPRIIVVSYVSSTATENHIASIAHWANTSAPPIYVFSPLETRLREHRALDVSLHHAIPISMYAWPLVRPPELSPGISTGSPVSPRNTNNPNPVVVEQTGRASSDPLVSGNLDHAKSFPPEDTSHSRPGRSTRRSSPTDPLHCITTPFSMRDAMSKSMSLGDTNTSPSYRQRDYPPDPVATLSVITEDSRIDPITEGPVPDRIPLWALAPGVGVLHGSTSVSLGIRLGDFSAFNLARKASGDGEGKAEEVAQTKTVRWKQGEEVEGKDGSGIKAGGDNGRQTIDVSGMGIKTSPMNIRDMANMAMFKGHGKHSAKNKKSDNNGGNNGKIPSRDGSGSNTTLTAAFLPPLDGRSAVGTRSHGTATPEPISRPGSTVSSRRTGIPGKDAGYGNAYHETDDARQKRRNGVLAHGDEPLDMQINILDTDHEARDGNANNTTGLAGQNGFTEHKNGPTIHLTPPTQDPRHLSPPDIAPPRVAHVGEDPTGANGSLNHPAGATQTQSSWHSPKSWPTLANKVPGWRRGRREVMEDALAEIGAGPGPRGLGRATEAGAGRIGINGSLAGAGVAPAAATQEVIRRGFGASTRAGDTLMSDPFELSARLEYLQMGNQTAQTSGDLHIVSNRQRSTARHGSATRAAGADLIDDEVLSALVGLTD